MTKQELLTDLSEQFENTLVLKKIARRDGNDVMKNYYQGRLFQIANDIKLIKNLNEETRKDFDEELISFSKWCENRPSEDYSLSAPELIDKYRKEINSKVRIAH